MGGALKPVYYNNEFPLSPDLDYKLELQYLWLNDNTSKPLKGDLQANILVNLWFVDTQSPHAANGLYKNALVIDLAFANLINKDGYWQQNSSLNEGGHYYQPYAANEISQEQSIYHYNTVLDTDGRNPNQWYAPSPE